MGTQSAPAQLFYDFDLECHVPDNHMLREIDRFLDIDGMRMKLRTFYSHLGRSCVWFVRSVQGQKPPSISISWMAGLSA